MLPFLKDRHEASMSGSPEPIKRERDEDKPYEMLDAIVEDLIDGVHKKDKRLVRSALEAFLEHIQDIDEVQDHEEF